MARNKAVKTDRTDTTPYRVKFFKRGFFLHYAAEEAKPDEKLCLYGETTTNKQKFLLPGDYKFLLTLMRSRNCLFVKTIPRLTYKTRTVRQPITAKLLSF